MTVATRQHADFLALVTDVSGNENNLLLLEGIKQHPFLSRCRA